VFGSLAGLRDHSLKARSRLPNALVGWIVFTLDLVRPLYTLNGSATSDRLITGVVHLFRACPGDDTPDSGCHAVAPAAAAATQSACRRRLSQPAPFLKTASAVIPETEAIDERERLLIEAVLSLARTLRDERDRLAERLRAVESELSTLASRLEIVGLEPPDSASEEINP